jgi:glycosyltransferase involved in cell wall biosynthesis
VHAPLGLAPEFVANPPTDPVAERVFDTLGGRPFLLHVGSCIPRKRVDFLLRVFIALRGRFPDLRLVKVGGAWSAEYLACIERHGLGPVIHHLDGVARTTLAALYHKTNLLMIPSESEGFGLPAIEGLACGALVLVSDLPVFREVGGTALLYAPPLDLEAWRDTAARVLAGSLPVPSLETRRLRARKFSWQEHARIIFDAYRELIA